MPSEDRKIDRSLGLGLHELASSGNGHFQLGHAKEWTEYILSKLDNLVQNTIDKAPTREGRFCLDRRANHPPLTHEEDKWERAMYDKWGPEGSGEYVPVCKRIQTYQYPLQAYRTASQPAPNNTCWGEIDLLGIGRDFLPVPIELKKRETNESPLRILVEVAAYGFAIRKVWPELRHHWIEAVRWFGGSPSQFPATLDRVTLVGVAPDKYWSGCLGLLPGTKKGKFPSEAWPPFWKLVEALERWFDIHFVAIKGNCDDPKGSPKITGARVLDLRSLTPNPAADTLD